ncbi:MAG: hypothetical protein GF410_16735 [Chitinivibrionales bacterium]|nr:hypothetical protein [Chitinivibrionales bacterium]
MARYFSQTQQYRTMMADRAIGAGPTDEEMDREAEVHERHTELWACGRIREQQTEINVSPESPAVIADRLRAAGGKLNEVMAAAIDLL